MTPDDAISRAAAARAEFGVPELFVPKWAKRRIVEIVPGQPVIDALPAAGPVIDRIAWIVHLGVDVLWVEFTIDDQTGRIIRFRRSRGAVASFDRESQ